MEKVIKPFEEILQLVGTEKEKADFADAEYMARMEPDEVAYKKAKILTRYKNTDPATGKVWTPDYTSMSRKYNPAACIEATSEQPAGVGFSLSLYDYWTSGTNVGVRLCTDTAEKAMSLVDEYPEIYKAFWL